jgi:hypothetical protein
MTMQGAGPLAPFKVQPWVLYDTVASTTFLLGAATNAIGGNSPAISSSGEITFFQSPGRTTQQMPWYTNMDQPGSLSYGMTVWQIYLNIMFPTMPLQPNFDPDAPAMAPTILNVPPTTRLAEAILNFGVFECELGQENQFRWPCTRFGAGSGLKDTSSQTSKVNNGDENVHNIIQLPEPIKMPRTQAISAKIRLAPEVFALIGTPAVPGVGAPLATQAYTVAAADINELQLQPYAIQVGFVGSRTKDTQYGMVPTGG